MTTYSVDLLPRITPANKPNGLIRLTGCLESLPSLMNLGVNDHLYAWSWRGRRLNGAWLAFRASSKWITEPISRLEVSFSIMPPIISYPLGTIPPRRIHNSSKPNECRLCAWWWVLVYLKGEYWLASPACKPNECKAAFWESWSAEMWELVILGCILGVMVCQNFRTSNTFCKPDDCKFAYWESCCVRAFESRTLPQAQWLQSCMLGVMC